MTLPPHISYSQYSAYTRCPRSWYLARLKGGEEKQSWYLPIGTVVHDAIEARVKGEFFDLTNRFYDLVAMQMQIEPDLSKWLAGGPEAAPIKEEKALQRAVECYEKAVQELDDIEVWRVEYDATGSLPGLEVPIKGFIDIVGEHKRKGPVIIDWKTGSTKPDNFQLQTYAALMAANNHADMSVDYHGRYVMLAPGAPNTRYVDLSKVDPAEVGAKYQKVYDQMKAKVYKANAGFDCRFCFQAENCLANKGMTERAMYYDRSEDDGYPF
jgi:putative RecB family exonuclease